MTIVDVGTGAPVVLVPGVQGRWEWMQPTVTALSRHCRVITFSYADEPTCGGRFDETAGLMNYVQQIADALDSVQLTTATICGVSYGGLVAAAFAARHPNRVSALVLVSAMPPSWKPDARVAFYLRAPRLLSPLFCLASLRLYREIATATPGFLRGVTAAVRIGLRALTHMFSPSRMARRVRWLESARPVALGRVTAPTLVVTGEPGLDRIVPVARTHEYLRMWPHATAATIARSGHLGILSRPDEFARIVLAFVERAAPAREERKKIG